MNVSARILALESTLEATRGELHSVSRLCVRSASAFMAFHEQFQDLAQECRLLCSILREIGLLTQADLKRHRCGHMFIRLFEELDIANYIMTGAGQKTAQAVAAVSPACIDAIVGHAIRSPLWARRQRTCASSPPPDEDDVPANSPGRNHLVTLLSSMLGVKLKETMSVSLRTGDFITPRGVCRAQDPPGRTTSSVVAAKPGWDETGDSPPATKTDMIVAEPASLEELALVDTPRESFTATLLVLLQDVWQFATLAESFTSVMEASTIRAFRTVSRAGRECMRIFSGSTPRSALPGLPSDEAFMQQAANGQPAQPESPTTWEGWGLPPAGDPLGCRTTDATLLFPSCGSQQSSSPLLVKLQGLRSRPELNGVLGKLLPSLDKSRGTVLLCSGERIRVRRDNLHLVASKRQSRAPGTQMERPSAPTFPTPLPMNPAPVVSEPHSTGLGLGALLKSAVYTCGGKNDTGISKKVHYFVPETFSWYTVKPMGTARYGSTVATVGSCLYVMGGFGGGSASLATVECFNLKASRWEAVPDMPNSRALACATVLGSDIYVGGGSVRGKRMKLRHVLCCFDRFSTVTKTWEALEDMKHARERAPIVALGGNIYVCGGRTHTDEVVTSVERFSPEQGAWTDEFPLPRECAMGAHCVHGDWIYLCGGGNRVRSTALWATALCVLSAQAVRFKHTTGRWEFLPQMAYARLGAIAVATPEGDVFVCGGCGTAVVECYRPTLAAWVIVEDMFTLHTNPCAVTLGDYLYILGGRDNKEEIDTAERMSIRSGKWEKLPPMPEAQVGRVAAALHP